MQRSQQQRRWQGVNMARGLSESRRNLRDNKHHYPHQNAESVRKHMLRTLKTRCSALSLRPDIQPPLGEAVTAAQLSDRNSSSSSAEMSSRPHCTGTHPTELNIGSINTAPNSSADEMLSLPLCTGAHPTELNIGSINAAPYCSTHSQQQTAPIGQRCRGSGGMHGS